MQITTIIKFLKKIMKIFIFNGSFSNKSRRASKAKIKEAKEKADEAIQEVSDSYKLVVRKKDEVVQALILVKNLYGKLKNAKTKEEKETVIAELEKAEEKVKYLEDIAEKAVLKARKKSIDADEMIQSL